MSLNQYHGFTKRENQLIIIKQLDLLFLAVYILLRTSDGRRRYRTTLNIQCGPKNGTPVLFLR